MIRDAIVGHGAGGHYLAEALLQKSPDTGVDFFVDTLYTGGLVREGVASDHQNLKGILVAMHRLLQDPRVRIWLNAPVGQRLQAADLLAHFRTVTFAPGAQGPQPLHIPGEELRGCIPSIRQIFWANGAHMYENLPVLLDESVAMIIGAGEVMMDVARQLAAPVEYHLKTDMADHAIAAYAQSQIRKIIIAVRRRLENLQFSAGSLGELADIPGVGFIISPEDLVLDDGGKRRLDTDEDFAKCYALMCKLTQKNFGNPSRVVEFKFGVSPAALYGEAGRVAAVKLGHNEVKWDPDRQDHVQIKTSRTTILNLGLVIPATGYGFRKVHGVSFNAHKVMFDTDGHGRLCHNGHPLQRQYLAGWAAQGRPQPRGTLGTNKGPARNTADTIMADIRGGHVRIPSGANSDNILDLLISKGIRPVTRDETLALQAEEDACGMEVGRPRIKMRRREALDFLKRLRGE